MKDKYDALMRAAFVLYSSKLNALANKELSKEDQEALTEISLYETIVSSPSFKAAAIQLGQNFVRYETAVAQGAIKTTLKNSALRNSTIGLSAKARRELKKTVLERVTSINDTSKDIMKNVFEDIIKKDGTLADLKVALKDSLKGQVTDGRINTIAETEYFTAYSKGQYDLNESLVKKGYDLVQIWRTVQDSNVRESHAAMEGEERAVGETFSNGGLHPHDPALDPSETVNCRCTLEIKIIEAP